MRRVLLLLTITAVSDGFSYKERKAVRQILETAKDTIRASELQLENMEAIRIENRNSPAYEMGYLMKTLQENYRKQLEKYMLVKHMDRRMYISEMIIYLMEIEHHYWESEHICNMIHEIERKYGIKVEGVDYESFLRLELKVQPMHQPTSALTTRRRRTHSAFNKKFRERLKEWREKGHYSPTTKNRTGSSWPFEYGWYIDEW